MIILTRLGGQPMALNPDLIERAEPTPDTVITMVDGHKLVVVETVQEVVDRVRDWRASVAAAAFALSRTAAAGDDPDDEAGELSEEDVAAHSVVGSSLARVLQLPPRED